MRGKVRRPAARHTLALLACTTVLAGPGRALAEEPVVERGPTRNLFGMTGLIDMPTAEMQPDGELSATVGYHGAGYLRNTISFQFMPWLETAFRYSALDDMTSRGETLYDRSFDAKVRLVTEGNYRPTVVLGLQDFLGTGVYSGQYMAATKRFLEGDLSVTGGFGWQRFAGEEPDFDAGLGGEVNFDQFFSGGVGFFGGARYETPIDGLTIKAEYSSDEYAGELRLDGYGQDLPVNFGAEYELFDGVNIGAYYMYGNEFGLRLSVGANPYRPAFRGDLEPGPLPLIPRPVPEDAGAPSLLGEIRSFVTGEPASIGFAEADLANVAVEEREGGLRWATATLPDSADYLCPAETATAIDAQFGLIDAVTYVHPDGTIVCSVALRPAGEQAMAEAVRENVDYPVGWYDDPEMRAEIVATLEETLEPESIGLYGIELYPRAVDVYVENDKFREWPRAVGRVARALTRAMPASVETFKIVLVERSLPVTAVYLDRSVLEQTVNRPDAATAIWAATRVENAEMPDWSRIEGVLDQYPRYDWSLFPNVPVSLFDPDDPVRFDVLADFSASVEPVPGLFFATSIEKRLIGELDDITRESDSELPRVRSNFRRYFQEGDPALTRLDASYLTKLDDDVYARVSGGLFERMFGGVSGEVLWKPVEQSWGLGLEVNWAKQRDFETLFGFRDYDVVTGHASLYWNTGVKGLYAQIDAGRYLAKDWGATFTLTRQFANGFAVGGFFTLTDVPFEKFGEGSFDKGLLFTIPLNWFTPVETQRQFSYSLRPLTRDGGQRLRVSNRLYPIIRDKDEPALGTDRGSFWN